MGKMPVLRSSTQTVQVRPTSSNAGGVRRRPPRSAGTDQQLRRWRHPRANFRRSASAAASLLRRLSGAKGCCESQPDGKIIWRVTSPRIFIGPTHARPRDHPRNPRPAAGRVGIRLGRHDLAATARSGHARPGPHVRRSGSPGIAAWLGWLFDGLDMHLYTLVAAPFVAELLQVGRSDRPGGEGTRARWIQAAFLVGWALGGGVLRPARRPAGPQPGAGR